MAQTTLILTRILGCVAAFALSAGAAVAAPAPQDPSVSQYVEQIPTAEGTEPTTPGQPAPTEPETEAPGGSTTPSAETDPKDPAADPPAAEKAPLPQEPESNEPSASEAVDTASAEDGLGHLGWMAIVLSALTASAIAAYVIRRRFNR